MGYEVLDSGGSAGRGSPPQLGGSGSGSSGGPGSSGGTDDGSRAAVDILELDVSATVADEPRAERRLTRSGIAVSALVLAALLAGALIGGLVTQRREEDQQRRARAATIAATGIVSELTSDSGGSVAVLTSRLVNHGPLPIEVVTTGGARPLGTTVSMVADSTTVDAGDTALLRVTAPLDCNESDVQDDVTVAVRTADQRMHQVSLLMPFGTGQTLRGAVCEDSGEPLSVEASLGSSINRPSLRLTNNGRTDLRISIVNGAALPPAEDGGPIATVTTVPSMPLLVRAGDSREVRLVVRVRRCLNDLARLANGNYLELESISSRNISRPFDRVDIGPVIGAAMSRTCPR
jgi:hypothetical protein